MKNNIRRGCRQSEDSKELISALSPFNWRSDNAYSRHGAREHERLTISMDYSINAQATPSHEFERSLASHLQVNATS
jgi:hypothetical protein